MALIARTPQIDDDGSGTTGTIWNNAWKTELYNQIDGTLGVGLGWTPTDLSGAGLTFTGGGGWYAIVGNVLHWWIEISYPTTASGANAILGNLPSAVQRIHSGGVSTFGSTIHIHTPAGDVKGYLLKATGAAWTNVELTGRLVIAQGAYYPY